MDREAVYLGMPVSVQNAVCSLEGLRIQRTRYGGKFDRILQLMERRSRWAHDRVIEYRDQRLHDFVQGAYQLSPFYRLLFDSNDIDPREIRSLGDLAKLPIIDKSTVQENIDQIKPKESRWVGAISVHTSGTTGGGLEFTSTRQAIREQWAVWWRYRRWHGLDRGTWCGYFGGRSVVPLSQNSPPFWRINIPGRQILFSGYHISGATIDHYIEKLRLSQPAWLHGYPSLLALVAGLVRDLGLDIGYVPRWITTGAENLLPQQSALIEQVFGVRPLQHYGMSEAVANFSECPNGNLHVDEDFAAVEFIPNDDRCGYRVIGTNFTNSATPLLRYDIGDVADVCDVLCDCGLPGRVVRRIDGRKEDYVILSDGTLLGRMDHIFKDMVSIREAQIHQSAPGEVTVRIVQNERFSAGDEAALRGEFAKRAGDKLCVTIKYSDRIERTHTGKLRFVTSSIRQGQLSRPPEP